MKKIFGAVLAFAASSALFAYNPPAGGQNVLRLSEPQLLAGGNSTAGGGLFDGGDSDSDSKFFGTSPSAILINPALTAWEQRNALDLSGTLLHSSNSDDDNTLGSSFQAGILLPSRWCVSTFLFQGVWSEFIDMPVGNNINISYGYAKDITDSVSVGISASFGYLFGDAGPDWTLSAGLGAYYNYGDWKFLKDIRFGASLLNLGKMYTSSDTVGIESDEDDFEEAGSWPALATLRTGVAAALIKNEQINLGMSLDFSYPSFQNLVIDAGLQMQIHDFMKVYSGWEFDAREFAEDSKNLLPSIGVSFKFQLNSKKDSFMAEKGWQQSEMTVSGGWKKMYDNINAFSAGAILDLGMKDTQAPEIKLWGED